MWVASLYPRISAYLPAEHILEIGCGRGRIAKLLTNHSTRMSLVDINESSVQHCIKLFSNYNDVSVATTDGVSLNTIGSNSVDFAFSFYSLVAADAFTICSYLSELQRVLKADGVAFLHHSNAAMYSTSDDLEDESIDLLSRYRDISVCASSVANTAEQFDLSCIRQECVNWDVAELLTDCFSTIVRNNSIRAQPQIGKKPEIIKNYKFTQERERARVKFSHGSHGNVRGVSVQ